MQILFILYIKIILYNIIIYYYYIQQFSVSNASLRLEIPKGLPTKVGISGVNENSFKKLLIQVSINKSFIYIPNIKQSFYFI